jgi:GNAT superfamily N-acetyltransferase
VGHRSSLFCDAALASRIEAAETELIVAASRAAQARSGTAGFVLPIGGGAATFAGSDSPFTKVVGLGFGGVPDHAAFDAVENAYAVHGSPVQVELAHLADPEIGTVLSDRGYRLEGFENVLGIAFDSDPHLAAPPGIEVRLSGDDEFEAWLAVVAEGSIHPDTEGLPWHDEFPREAVEDAERDFAVAGVTRYAALREGVLAGGADFRITNGIAQLAGAATLPAHRRRGVQTALLATRLADARAAGCTIAVLAAQPGSPSHHNAQRSGFDLLYTRATLVKNC